MATTESTPAEFQEEPSRYPESQGVAAFSASSWDHAKWGGDGSGALTDAIFGLLFPAKDRLAAGVNNDFRDAKHLATAIEGQIDS